MSGRTRNTRNIFPAGAVLLVLFFSSTACTAPQYFTGVHGAAIKGYDVVAYFEENRARFGSEEHAVEWDGAVWHFSSAGNAQLFREQPRRYVPQYGGYCAFAAAHNAVAAVDPEAFSVVDGKLYLNNSFFVHTNWRRKQQQFIELADGYWPRLRRKLSRSARVR